MKLLVAGCGPAGLFAAICAARAAPGLEVTVLERDQIPMRWMGAAGKPRALTCAGLDPNLLARAYPHGSEFMHGAVQAWPPAQMLDWLRDEGIETRAEAGGVFPAPGLAGQRLGQKLLEAAARAGVRVQTGIAVAEVAASTNGFNVWMKSGPSFEADRLLLATGGRAGQTGWNIAKYFGHSVHPFVPSPVLLQTRDARAQTGVEIDVPGASATLPQLGAEATGGVSLLPSGIGGNAVLEIAARRAHELASLDYKCILEVNWVADAVTGQPTRTLRQMQ